MNITVCHGSKAKFDRFDLAKIRSSHGTNEGVGIYFTTNKNIANGYAGSDGYLYTVTLNGHKPLDPLHLTITRSALRKLITGIEKAGIPFLSNYGEVKYEGLKNVMNEALDSLLSNTSDVDLISELFSSEGGNKTILELVYHVLGYDYFTCIPDWASDEQRLYVALVPDILQIKSIESMTQKLIAN